MIAYDNTALNASHLFARDERNNAQRACSIGIEIEFLAQDVATRSVSLLEGKLGAWLSDAAASKHWNVVRTAKGAPKYVIDGGVLTLEPGGQIEFSSVPLGSPSSLVALTRRVVGELRTSAVEHGIELLAAGIDPARELAEVPLQLDAPRYRKMDAFFRAVSPSGVRMMRQTAALQVNIGAVHDAATTWNLLNRAAPILTALFANSRTYAGADSGYASYRAATWQEIDPTRTGLMQSDTPPQSYREFAMSARCIGDAPAYRPFGELSDVSLDEWEDHLSTLFPEVRPRGFYELRCIDSIPADFIAAPLLVVAAITWDTRALEEAFDILREPSRDLWERAARYGMEDAAIARTASELVRITRSACSRAEPSFCSAEDVEALDAWMERSVSPRGTALENDFVGNDHVANDAVTCLRK